MTTVIDTVHRLPDAATMPAAPHPADPRTPPEPAPDPTGVTGVAPPTAESPAELAARLAEATTRLRQADQRLADLADAHRRLADGVRRELAAITDRRLLRHQEANTVLARLGVAALPKPVSVCLLTFRVPLRITVSTARPDQARPEARDRIAAELARRRPLGHDTPRIEAVTAQGTDRDGRTRFQVHAVAWLTVEASGTNRRLLWPAARAILTDELARLRHIRLAGRITQAEEHRLYIRTPLDADRD